MIKFFGPNFEIYLCCNSDITFLSIFKKDGGLSSLIGTVKIHIMFTTFKKLAKKYDNIWRI